MIRVLFVDDEPNILQGLQRMLRPLRTEWDMSFAGSGHEALEKMAACPCDVIVSDVKMPGMNGAQLLSEVMNLYPRTIRIVLSGHSDREHILELVGKTHQYLSKPCDAEILKDAVTRSFALQDCLGNPNLKLLLTQVKSLPSLPVVYTEVMEALQNDKSSMQEIGRMISRDMAMSAKILQMVNSVYFGLGNKINDLSQAVVLMGVETIKTLMLSAHVFSRLPSSLIDTFSLDAVWSHSLLTGRFARAIADAEHVDRKVAEACSTAGFLHDIGKLVMAANISSEYAKILLFASRAGVPSWQAEQELQGCTHADVGAYLLGIWGLSQPVVEAIALHHRPTGCHDWRSCPMAIVYCANVIAHEITDEVPLDGDDVGDMEEFEVLGVSDRLENWRKVCREAVQREKQNEPESTLRR